MTTPDHKKPDFVIPCCLVQHTPMLHFQHKETGVCLRGTEVKAKLDRFLLAQWRNEPIPPDWLIKNSPRPALKYKIRIEGIGTPHKTYEINKSYFGNMGAEKKGKEKLRTIFYKDGLELEIICFNKELRDHIKAYLADFFLTHNFSTRQSKGFGSFTVIPVPEKEEAQEALKKYFPHYIHCPGGSDPMERARILYALLKSGLNFTSYIKDGRKQPKNPKDYFKGFLIRQYIDMGIGSDKAFIKSEMKGLLTEPFQKIEVLTDRDLRTEAAPSYKTYLFIRAMLGLTDGYTFRDEARNDTVSVKPMDENINRFRSPITIKIIGNDIYFLPHEIPEIMLEAPFHFSSQKMDQDR